MNRRLRLTTAFWGVALLSVYGVAQQTQQPSGSVTNVQVNVNRILVPVVVRNRQTQTVGDLKKEDFTVLDNGNPRPISGFVVEYRSSAPAVDAGGISAPNGKAQATTLPDRIVVLLFDDMHLNAEELAHVKLAAEPLVTSLVNGSHMAAVVSLSGSVNSGLTRDAAKLQAALKRLKPQPIYRSEAAACGYIDYYEADLIANHRDDTAMQDALKRFALCNPSIQLSGAGLAVANGMVESAARRALVQGALDISTTYANLGEFVRRMEKLPGQRTLILVSPGFLNVETEALTAESQIVNAAAQYNVTISALDARGLYSSEVSASERGEGAGGTNIAYHREEMRLAEDPMAELANGTGGTFFHNRNDLGAGLQQLTEAPEVVYLLEIPVDDEKTQAGYHRLKVAVDRDGLEVQARRGYLYPQADKKK
jgi:VWFA-related protein